MKERAPSLAAVGVVLSMFGLWEASCELRWESSSTRRGGRSPSTGFLNSAGGYPLAFYVSARSIMAIFLRRDVLVPSFANAVCQLGAWAVIYGFLPLLARQLGAGEVSVGLLVTTALAANAATNLVMTVTSRRGSPPWILHGSFVLFAAGILVAAVGRTIPLLFVATAAMGIHQAVYAIGMFVGPSIGGVLADAMGIRAMFVIDAIFCVVAANVLIAFHPRLPTTTASDTLAADDQIHLRS